MFVLANFIIALAKILQIVLNLYSFILLAWVILSWIRPQPHQTLLYSIFTSVYQLTEPVLKKIRPLLPNSLYTRGIDFTPLLLFIIIVFLETLVVSSLFEYASRLKLGM